MAELLSQLPPEMDVENLVLSSSSQQEEEEKHLRHHTEAASATSHRRAGGLAQSPLYGCLCCKS